MKRIALVIQYDGTDFSGWQVQENAIGVQNVIEEILEKIVGKRIPITGAGRTDKGVHALCQIAHFDTELKIPGDKWKYHFNAKLPDSIRIVRSKEVPRDFHARYDALKKKYQYTIYRDAIRPPQYRNYTAHVSEPLSMDLMEKGVHMLVGTHDFHAFMSTGSPVNNTIRTLDTVEIVEKENLLLFTYEAQSFLYNMVRIMTGTLLEIGMGKRSLASIEQAFSTRKREDAGITMPAQGLTLMKITYEEEL